MAPPTTALSPVSSRRTLVSSTFASSESFQTFYGQGKKSSMVTEQDVEEKYRHLRPPASRSMELEYEATDDFNYKPTAMRWWFLTIVLVCLVSLIAVVEYSIFSLPNYSDSELSNLTHHLFGRELEAPPGPPSTTHNDIGPTSSRSIMYVPLETSKYLHGGQFTDTTVAMTPPFYGPTTTNAGTNLDTATYLPSAPDGYLNPGQGVITMTTRLPAGTTSFCFTCGVPSIITNGPGGYLNTGQATSTALPPGFTGVTTTQVSVVPQITTIPGQTITRLSTFVNAAGSTVTQAIPTTIPPSTVTTSSSVTIPPGKVWTTLTTTHNGIATPIPTLITMPSLPDTNSTTITVIVGLTPTAYLAGAFLPTVLAVLLLQPLKLLAINAKLFQPFHALTRPSPARHSVFLPFYGWPGLFVLPRAIWYGQGVIVLTEAVTILGALVTPLAAEAVAVHVPEGCTGGCYGDIGVAGVPVRVLEGVLIAIAVVVAGLLYLLGGRRWITGVKGNPWSVAGMASLGLGSEIKGLLQGVPRGCGRKVADVEVREVLDGRLFALRRFKDTGLGGERGYGIVVPGYKGIATWNVLERKESADKEGEEKVRGKKRIMSFALLTWWGRGLLLFSLSSIFIILTYYETTSEDSGFERFMDSQGFGVRFFFTALGVLLGFGMATFFRCVAVLSPYLLLSRQPMLASRSILLSPPTNPFTGLRTAFLQRNPYLGVLAIATILAELFLPVTLAHVPFSLVETHQTQVVCAWMSIAILAFMVLAVASSFLIKWPHMPVDPRTIAGALFYVCDSWMLESLEGLASAGKEERDHVLERMSLQYSFGNRYGVSGLETVGIDDLGKEGMG